MRLGWRGVAGGVAQWWARLRGSLAVAAAAWAASASDGAMGPALLLALLSGLGAAKVGPRSQGGDARRTPGGEIPTGDPGLAIPKQIEPLGISPSPRRSVAHSP